MTVKLATHSDSIKGHCRILSVNGLDDLIAKSCSRRVKHTHCSRAVRHCGSGDLLLLVLFLLLLAAVAPGDYERKAQKSGFCSRRAMKLICFLLSGWNCLLSLLSQALRELNLNT